jgi:hypothetical protein
MFKRFLSISAVLALLTACTGTPAAPEVDAAPGRAPSFNGGGFGSGTRTEADSGWTATASTDSTGANRGGGAIGSGN